MFDRACRPALVTRHGDKLSGILSRDVTRTRHSISESYDVISIGTRMAELCGNRAEYERNAAGKWEKTLSQGFGCADSIGYILSKVSEDAAWYNAAAAHLSIDCNRKVEEETPCADGKARVCERCEDWKLMLHSSEWGFTTHRTVGVRRATQSSAGGCSSPCPVEEPPAGVTRANAALRGHVFFTTAGDPHPFVFRTKAACRAYQKVHRFNDNELDVWRAGRPRPPELVEAEAED